MGQNKGRFLAHYSVAAFFVLAFVLGGGFIYLIQRYHLPPVTALVSVLSASIAGITMTAVEDGRDGLKLMFSRLMVWRVGIGYWLFAFFFLVPAILIGSAFNPLFGGDTFSFTNLKPAFPIFPMFVAFFALSGVGQELGWTGYLAPRLQARYSALTACAIRAVLSSIWHIPLFLFARFDPRALAGFPYPGWIAQRGFLAAFLATMLLFQLPWAVLFYWIFNNTRGSLLLVAVLHGSEIWTAYWMASAGIDPGNLDNYWGYGGAMVVAAALIVLAAGTNNLSRRYARIVH